MSRAGLVCLAWVGLSVAARAELSVIDFEDAKENAKSWQLTWRNLGACHGSNLPNPRRGVLTHWQKKGATNDQLRELSKIMEEANEKFDQQYMQALTANLVIACTETDRKSAEYRGAAETNFEREPKCGEHNGRMFCE